ncbi:hypothetical protein AYI70_g4704 [Smittium culicis]|uniref:GPI ethanolamine phosphate transferase 2 C-terminal domain-containing protein n=1 Tax=Smittium culicis TaxID=133412 RepID=A0A1R1XY52_9FUNG|nr:hypothetical protein AYI70_g4704 [Smittium culicis]
MCNFAAPIFFTFAALAIVTAYAAASFAATSALIGGPSYYNNGNGNGNGNDSRNGSRDGDASAYVDNNGATASNVFFFRSRAYLLDVPLLTLTLNSLLLVVLFVSICFFKTHLFIWSVFAPKLLYSVASNSLNIVLFLFSLAIYTTLSLYL